MYPMRNLNTISKTIMKRICVAYCTNSHRDVRTHYDVLKLSPNCSDQQIKDSFAKLSKECHPDVSKSKNAHHEFMRLMEASKTLGKPRLRERYDYSLGYRSRMHSHGGTPKDYESYMHRPWGKAANFGRNQSNTYPNTSKYLIGMVCGLIAVLGAVLQISLVRLAYSREQKIVSQKTEENGRMLARLRNRQSQYLNNGEHVEDILSPYPKNPRQEFDNDSNPK